MSNQTFMTCLIIRRNIMLCHPLFHNGKKLFINRCLNTAMGRIYDDMAVPGIKSCDDLSVFAKSHRELCLIAVIIRFFHSDDRMHHIIFYMSHTAQQVPDLVLLESQLTFIGQMLDLTAAAAAGVRTWCLHPIR